jgi:phenylacetate-CoA ligase
MHLFEDLFIVENVDADGEPVADGEVGHKVLLTNLFNLTQPLIRYELSDMVVLDSRPCSCGRMSRRVTSIEGRSDDVLPLSGPTGTQIAIHPTVLRRPFLALPMVRQYKLVLEEVGPRVLLVLADEAPVEETKREVRSGLVAALAHAGAASPTIVVAVVEALARDQGHGAKFRLIESRGRPLGETTEESRVTDQGTHYADSAPRSWRWR